MGPHRILAIDVICHPAGPTDEVFGYVARRTLGFLTARCRDPANAFAEEPPHGTTNPFLSPPYMSTCQQQTESGDVRRDAPDFVEVGEAGVAVSDAMRHQRCVQLVG